MLVPDSARPRGSSLTLRCPPGPGRPGAGRPVRRRSGAGAVPARRLRARPAGLETAISRHRWLIRTWLRQHPAALHAFGNGEEDCWVDRVFERFWRAVTPARFGSFASFARLLAYLKLCTQSVLLTKRAGPRPATGAGALLSLDQETGLRLHAEAALQAADVDRRCSTASAGDLWRAVAGALADEAPGRWSTSPSPWASPAPDSRAFLMLSQRGGRLPGQAERPAQAAPQPGHQGPGWRLVSADTRRTPTADSLIQPGAP